MIGLGWFIVAVFVGLCAYGFHRRNRTSIDPKVAEVERLPAGIEVVHTPSRVKAVEGLQGRYNYTWLYETRVRSLVGPLKITEFGSFSFHRGAWVFNNYTGKVFSGDDFASWYSCPNATLTVGGAFSDPQNWTGNVVLPTRVLRSRWYYIGVDSSGKRYKGEALVEHLPQLDRNSK